MNSSPTKISFLENIPLSKYTTIGLGGSAKYFLSCRNLDEVLNSLQYCRDKEIPVQVFSGGSNIIFDDRGFEGLVLKIDIKGINFSEEGNYVYAGVNAGEEWDNFVVRCIENGLTGVECLSGIPGSVGATPIQNVGAYGQEVGDTIVSLKAISRESFEEIQFSHNDLDLSYRESRFKNYDKDKYIITHILFRFEKNRGPEIKYSELQKRIDSGNGFGENDLSKKLMVIRNSVLELRLGKSMLIDKSDPNSRSCGSFFMNPVLNETEFERFRSQTGPDTERVPVYRSGDKFKLSAAWLVEETGFKKGYVYKRVGISGNHSLALINIEGTTEELLELAAMIERDVFAKFGIRLIKEPVIAGIG